MGWTLSRIQEATGIRRKTISGYMKAAGIAGSMMRPHAGSPLVVHTDPASIPAIDAGSDIVLATPPTLVLQVPRVMCPSWQQTAVGVRIMMTLRR